MATDCNHPTPEYLSVREVADILGLHYQTVLRHVREGTIPAVRIGRSYRISRHELDHILKQGTITDDP